MVIAVTQSRFASWLAAAAVLLVGFEAAAQPFASVESTSGLGLVGPPGGVGWADFNGDGCLDVLAHTSDVASAYSHLFRSNCAATPTFTDITSTHAAALATTPGNRSVVWGDLSGDGHPDFVRNNPVEIWINRGPSATPAYSFGSSTGTPSQSFSTWSNYAGYNVEGLALLDYDADGDLDIVAENADFGIVMLQNTGGTFTELAPAATGLPATGLGNGDYLTVGDFDVDGDVDIVVRKDADFDLWVNDGDGTFTVGTFNEAASNLDKGGVNFCDFDNDGDFDIFWTSAPTSQIWRQTTTGTFVATGQPATSAAVTIPANVDDASCGDVDNDGDLDILLVGTDYVRLFVNTNPSTLAFTEYSTGLSQTGNSEGANFVDYDNDGDLDYYVSEPGDNDHYRNNGTYPNYLVAVPRHSLGAGRSRVAVGATVTLRDADGNNVGGVRQVEGGSGHGTAGDGGLRVHFGLPNGSDAEYALDVGFVGGTQVYKCVNPSDLVGYRVVDVMNTAVDDFAACPAVVAISAPGATPTTNPRPVISGTASPNAMVTVVINGGTANEQTATVSADASGNWSHTPAADLPEGNSVIQATATRGLGQTATANATATVDSMAPTITIGQPTMGAVTGRRPAISGTTEPGATVSVDIDGTVATVTADGMGNWSYTPPTDLIDGMHTVTVTATDGAGGMGTASTTFTSDADECADGTDNCDTNATCTNTVGAFTCMCNPGFAGIGTSCMDIDECTNGMANCDTNATCMNFPGSFMCACNAGYTGDGSTCTDIDECADGTAGCDMNAVCTNDVGAFMCACNAGYVGDGFSCTDVDECADGTHDCDVNATCTNMPGAFDCTCNTGYFGSGQICTLTPGCQNGAVEDAEECDDGNADNNDSCLASCTAARCGDGYRWDGVEECDDGNLDEEDGCSSDCLVTGCGDGTLQDAEECDEGVFDNANEPNACRTDCTLPICGDGIVDFGELCDAGAQNGATPEGCQPGCTYPTCGDGTVDPGETCDDGAANSADEPDACRPACVAAYCGDGVVDDGEGCDDGILGSDTCSTQCQVLTVNDFGSGSPGGGGGGGGGGGLSVDTPEGCGCATTRGADGSLLVLLLGFGWLRRRRKQGGAR